MSDMTRRNFIKLVGGASAVVALGGLPAVRAANKAHVIVIGGGFGGAACAKYLRLADPGIAVTLIEESKQYLTCPFSNLVLGGLRTMDSIVQRLDLLKTRHGVNLITGTVAAIDPAAKKITIKGGKTLSYDRLVVSPGISFRWDAITGYNEKASTIMPHAWKAGPQTVLLKKKLEAMKNGGVVVISSPPNPFRCPPGPYERASMIAHYLKQRKPKSKILILDAKDNFSKQGLFQAGWETLYPGMIDWIPGSKGGTVKSVDTKKMIIDTEFDKHKADVANIIPPQAAGAIARAAGLADDKGFCPVDPKTFESTLHRGIHVIGDSAIAGALPKSAFAANSEAKMAATAIASALRGEPIADALFVNTCYSLLAPQYGISVAGVYRATEKGIAEVPGAGGVSPKDANADFRAAEARYAFGWYASIAADTWG